jgi:hypothetical protein
MVHMSAAFSMPEPMHITMSMVELRRMWHKFVASSMPFERHEHPCMQQQVLDHLQNILNNLTDKRHCGHHFTCMVCC